MEEYPIKKKGRLTTKDIPIKNEYWYIVDMKNLLAISLYPVYFTKKVHAKNAVLKELGAKQLKKLSILRGNSLKKYPLKYTLNLGLLHKYTKYTYTSDEAQKRKSFRTLMRRRLRRMGILSLPRVRYSIKAKVSRIKNIVNNQEVANSPNSKARLFQIDSKNPKYLFLVLKKDNHSHRKILFKIKVLRINTITGEYKKMYLNVYKGDILTPYITTEVFELLKGHTKIYDKLYRYCVKRNIRISKRYQKS